MIGLGSDKKYPGTNINWFPDVDLRETYYIDRAVFDASCSNTVPATDDCEFLFRPEWTQEADLPAVNYTIKWFPFQTCKSDCPGGKFFLPKILENYFHL